MKYSDVSRPIACIMRHSTCYKNSGIMNPVGVLWHSTGANNPKIKRYVQPDDDAADRNLLLTVIGTNRNGNDWNHTPRQAGVNAFIGKLEDGTVAAVQTLPWNFRPWGCGAGNRGSCNRGWVQFEICEDALNNPDYARQVFEEGCQLTAYLCLEFNIDPYGNKNGVPLITCHREAAELGYASFHADILHWLPKWGYDMAAIRNRVAEILAGKEKEVPPDPASDWAADAWAWAYETGLMNGEDPHGFVTREMLAVILARMGVSWNV